ncbi:MAG: nucleotidyltransferase family protein [Candidatus Omnitrophota bacterium]|jgi:D-glycero-alpha-D-manno-heptose 1-phosphate guanylyltransferase
MKIDAIILAGGLGKRLRSAICNLPKVLAPVNGRPFLDILLGYLQESKKIRHVVLAAGYMSDDIIGVYGKGKKYNFDIIFSVEKKALGTGGAIRKALSLTDTEHVLVLNGDSYINADIPKLLNQHLASEADMSIVLKYLNDVSRYGAVTRDKNNRIIKFSEKSKKMAPGYINAGIYLFKRDLFDKVKSHKKLSLERDLLPCFLSKGVYGYICNKKFIDIGIPETYARAASYLKQN